MSYFLIGIVTYIVHMDCNLDIEKMFSILLPSKEDVKSLMGNWTPTFFFHSHDLISIVIQITIFMEYL